MARHAWCVTLLLILAALPVAAQDDDQPVYYFNPDWSPDGTKLVFESTRDGNYAVYTINVDGTGLTKLTTGEADDEQPRWSPDGERIVFISDRDGHLQLYVMQADGTGQRRLTRGEAIDYSPMWSPDGRHVVFISRTDQASVLHDLMVIREDGTGRRAVTADSTVNDLMPRWSPDGAWIVFMRNVPPKRNYRDMSPEERAQMQRSAELFIIRPDGTGLRNLTENEVRDCCAHWAADSRLIYFHSLRDGAPGVYAMRPDGSDVRHVADGTVVPDPKVSPDGKTFTYTKEVEGAWGVYLYTLATGEERLLIGGAEQ